MTGWSRSICRSCSAAPAPRQWATPTTISIAGARRICAERLREKRALVDRDDADPTFVDADRAQRPLHDLDAAVKIERHAERENERRTDHVAVADDDRSRVAVALGDIEDRLY